jgi:hypothetical protein
MRKHTQQKRGWEFILIILASTVLAILLHQLHHDPLMNSGARPQSIVITSGWFPPVATVALAFTFCVMGLIFLGIQKELQSTKIKKGLLFGLALSGMYIMGMIETHVIFPVSLFGELYTGIADSCGILLLGLLLGKHMADDRLVGEKTAETTFPAILAILVMYVVVRYFSYAVFHIDSSYTTRPLATFLWTAGMGGWIGVMYRLVGRDMWPSHPLKRAVVFGGLVFGLNWFIFNVFVLLFIVIPVWDLVCRSVFDAFAVIIGVYISSLFHRSSRVTSSIVN